MINNVSNTNFRGHIAGKGQPSEQIDLTPKGNPYKKTNSWGKFGGTIGGAASIAALGWLRTDEYLCNATKLADKVFGKMKFFKDAPGKIIGAVALASGVVALSSGIAKGLFGLLDNNINKKRAAHADKAAEIKLEKAVQKAIQAENTKSAENTITEKPENSK